MRNLELSPEAARVLDALRCAGIGAWIVGGCVRDMLRGEKPGDWDIAAAATPDEIEAALSAFRLIETGIRHGTVTALVGGTPVEVTACRGEGAYRDLRHPDSVSFNRSIEEDLARRDFTINALAYAPETGLIDLFGGVADLEKGLIRCIRRPEDRFGEDALRILRALRFASTLGFGIEAGTAAAIHKLAPNIRAISAERCAAEFLKLLLGDRARAVLEEYADVAAIVLPVVRPMLGFTHREEHGGDLWRHSVAALDFAPRDPAIRLALILRDCGKPGEEPVGNEYPAHAERGAELAARALQDLRLPRALTERVTALVRYHSALPDDTESAVLHALNRLGEDVLSDLLDMRGADRRAHGETTDRVDALRDKIKELTARGACYRLSQLALSGNDLAVLGYAGREIGETLSRLLSAVMDGACANTPAALRAYLAAGDQIPSPPAT